MKPHPRGNQGAYVLHVQCPWRLEHDGRIYTGESDLWDPSSDAIDDADWDYEKGNLQDERLHELLGGTDPVTGSTLNVGGLLTVESASGTELGDAVILLSGGYRLVIWPDGSAGESWRLLGHQVAEHFVICGGEIEGADE